MDQGESWVGVISGALGAAGGAIAAAFGFWLKVRAARREERREDAEEEERGVNFNVRQAREHAREAVKAATARAERAEAYYDKLAEDLGQQLKDLAIQLKASHDEHRNCLQLNMASATKIEALERENVALKRQIEDLRAENDELRGRMSRLENHGGGL